MNYLRNTKQNDLCQKKSQNQKSFFVFFCLKRVKELQKEIRSLTYLTTCTSEMIKENKNSSTTNTTKMNYSPQNGSFFMKKNRYFGSKKRCFSQFGLQQNSPKCEPLFSTFGNSKLAQVSAFFRFFVKSWVFRFSESESKITSILTCC